MNTEMTHQMFFTAWRKIKDLLWGKLYYVKFSFQIQISCIVELIKLFISCLWQNNLRSVNPQEATPNCWMGVASWWCYLSKFSESHPIFNIIGRKPNVQIPKFFLKFIKFWNFHIWLSTNYIENGMTFWEFW